MKYYIKSNGKTYGPVEETKIKDHVISGYFSEDCQVSADYKEWVPLGQCIKILPSVPAVSTDSNSDNEIMLDKKPQLRLTESDVVHPAGEIQKKKHPPRYNRKMAIILAVCTLAAILLGCCIFFLFGPVTLIKKAESSAPRDFQQVCRLYQSAVGVVVVILEDSDGALLSGKIGNYTVQSDYPIGTAFAIDKDKFATNCHVAYAVKNQKSGVLEDILWNIVIKDAQRYGVKSKAEFEQYCRKNEKVIENARNWLHKNVRVRNVEIRLAHTGGRSLSVIGVQIHPRYQANQSTEFKNGEFDVAILTTSETVNRFFKTAPLKKLYALAQGQEIAYLGFPMEGLHDNGNLDLYSPEAIFKSGTINKITAFTNVFSSPEFNKSIIHDIPAAGGASGSPIFLPDGEVVAILWGVTHSGKNQLGRIASAIQHNMALRIDAVDIVKKQKLYSMKEWLGEDKK